MRKVFFLDKVGFFGEDERQDEEEGEDRADEDSGEGIELSKNKF